jgi:sigma-B regulation protein RsbU (phosphoserine phosphatase)
LNEEVLTALRGQITGIAFGTAFVCGGLAAAALAAMRRRSGARILVWLGAWSALYGVRLLAVTPAVVAALPRWAQLTLPYLTTSISYLLVVVASLAWLGLSRGRVRLLLQCVVIGGLAIAVGGVGVFLWTGEPDAFRVANNVLAICTLLMLLAVVMVPSLSRRYLVLSDHSVLSVGSALFALEGLYANAARPLDLPYYPEWGHFGFAALLLSFAFASVQMILDSERRLLAIESELEIARRLQFSIMPTAIPSVRGVRIAAAYQPMTAVAGDFYEFVAADEHRVGLLIADVSGHGVPAALIASMIKIATQSVVSCAHDPRAVLRGLDRVLADRLGQQFVSAAYLWLDTQKRSAWYSSAGHPPLLLRRDGQVQRIESNGVVFGFARDGEYPVREIPLHAGDRFVLYTDGVIEAESAAGEFFGDRKLEEVVRNDRLRTPADLSEQLLLEIRRWRPASMPQQDDITLVIVDADLAG